MNLMARQGPQGLRTLGSTIEKIEKKAQESQRQMEVKSNALLRAELCFDEALQKRLEALQGAGEDSNNPQRLSLIATLRGQQIATQSVLQELTSLMEGGSELSPHDKRQQLWSYKEDVKLRVGRMHRTFSSMKSNEEKNSDRLVRQLGCLLRQREERRMETEIKLQELLVCQRSTLELLIGSAYGAISSLIVRMGKSSDGVPKWDMKRIFEDKTETAQKAYWESMDRIQKEANQKLEQQRAAADAATPRVAWPAHMVWELGAQVAQLEAEMQEALEKLDGMLLKD